MGKLFRIDSPFSQAMSELFDLIALNILFLLTCVPVFTIGAALSALHSVGLKQAVGEELPVVKTYFHEFKKNFRQATIAWIPLLLLGVFLLADYFLAANGGSGGKRMQFAFGVMLLLYLCEVHYLFPMIARYENTLWKTAKNALLVAIRFFPKTLALLALSVIPPVLAICGSTELFVIWQVAMLVIGFSLTIILQDRILNKIFSALEMQMEE